MPPPADPVTTALMAPGVRTVVIPKQRSALTIVIPPCGNAEIKQESTKTPPGSNQVVVPKSALDQTVAVQPCVQGAKNAKGRNTVLLSPGGAGGSQSSTQKSGQPANQVLLPRQSNLAKIIVPPCTVKSSSSSSSSGSGGPSGGTNTALPSARGKTTVTAPPCEVQMTSSSSS